MPKLHSHPWLVALKQPSYILLPASSSSRLNRLLQFSAFGLIFFGIKMLLIQHFGNATPFWDQWDAEALNLYEPYLNGKLTFKNLLAAHNEHRIFTTRLLALALLQINNSWNPLLQMVVNAGLHTLLLIVAVYQLSGTTGRNYLPAILFFTLILFALPFGWENTLAGFQSQFYFALLFGFLTIWNLITANPLSARWWLGILWATLAFFSLASGIFALGAATGICIIRYIFTPQKSLRQLAAIVLMAFLFITGVKNTPTIPDHVVYKANSIDQLYNSLLKVFAWPLKKSIITVLLVNVPSLIFLTKFIRRRPSGDDKSWYMAGLIVWSVAQLISISYGRASINLSPRYLDVFSINILVNYISLLMLTKFPATPKPLWATGTAICWTVIILFVLGVYAGRHSINEIQGKHANSILQEANTRNYLATGDIEQLKNKFPVDIQIPYPNPDRLAFILSKPVIKRILPANINKLKLLSSNNPTGAFIPGGYLANTPYRSEPTMGSYHTKGNGSEIKGTLSLFFNNDRAGYVQFDVTGYPAFDSMKIELEQKGQRKPIKIKDNPESSWATIYTKVNEGPFSLILTDSNSTAEMAITMPSVSGNINKFTNITLSGYFVFISLGLLVLSILIVNSVLSGKFAELSLKEK